MVCLIYPMLERRHKFSCNSKLVCSFDSFISFSCRTMENIWKKMLIAHDDWSYRSTGVRKNDVEIWNTFKKRLIAHDDWSYTGVRKKWRRNMEHI